MYALFSKNLKLVRIILAQKADVNIAKNDKWTALHVAVDFGYVELIPDLIAKGALIDIKGGEYGITSLQLAVKKNNMITAKALLAHKADVNATDHRGHVALHDAIDSTFLDIIPELILNKANIDAQDKNGLTPLHYAIQGMTDSQLAETFSSIKCLVKHKADVNIADEQGKTPLEYAAEKGILDQLTQTGKTDSLVQSTPEHKEKETFRTRNRISNKV